MGLQERALQLHYHAIQSRFRSFRSPQEQEVEKLIKINACLRLELEKARKTIRDLTPHYSIMPSINRIIDFVCEKEEVLKPILIGHTREAKACLARHIAMFLTTQLTPHSLPQIAGQFGGRDHTTILHGKRRILREMHQNREFENKINSYLGALNEPNK